MTSFIQAVSIGLISGLLTAAGGAYKDAKWEPFSWLTFSRSPIVGACWGGLLWWVAPDTQWLMLGCACVGGERLSVEAWKALWRRMPSKFKHPTRDTGWLRERFRIPPR